MFEKPWAGMGGGGWGAESIIKWEGWGLHGKKWRKIYDPYDPSLIWWVNVWIYKKVSQALLTCSTSIHGNNIPTNGPRYLEEFQNLLKHLIGTLSRHQTDGLEYGKRGLNRIPLYTLLHLKTYNDEGGLLSVKYCQCLINKVWQTN